MKQLRQALIRSGVLTPFMNEKRADYCSRLLVKFQSTGDKKSLVEYAAVKKSLPKGLARQV